MANSVSPHLKWSFALSASSVLSALGLTFLSKSGAINDPATYILLAVPSALMILAFVIGRRVDAEKVKASHRYLWRVALCMVFYLVTLSAAEILIEDKGLGGWMAVVLASLPGLSFAGIIWVFGVLIVEEKDEFMRLLHVRQGLIATGIVLTLAAVWGFLETYRIVAPVAAFWWPTLWCFGIGVGAIFNKIKYGIFGDSA